MSRDLTGPQEVTMSPFGEVRRSIPAGRALLALLTVVMLEGSGPAVGATADAPPGGTAAAARGAPARMERFVATVKAVDLSGGTLDLVTGMGLALRIHRVHLPTPLRVKGAAPESAAAVLTRGCIVSVECHVTTTGTYASTVELMRAAPRGVKP